jgi:FkbM family methyltransferase
MNPVLIDLGDKPVTICGHADDPYFTALSTHVNPLTMSAYLDLVRAAKPALMFDIGANIGVTAALAHAIAPRKIIAVEPSPRAFACLEATAKSNTLDAECVCACIGAENGETGFLEAQFLAGSHRVRGGQRVPMLTLESLAQVHGAPDFVKIDVEGFELDVLAGAGELLTLRDPIFFMEVNAFTLCAYGKLSPITLLEQVRERFGGGFFARKNGRPVWAESDGELVGYLHYVMIERGCVDDIAFSASASQRGMIEAAWAA